ncbi:hypothetical protein VPH35_082333 [Triticum aestivum]
MYWSFWLEHGGANRRRRRDGGGKQQERSCNQTCLFCLRRLMCRIVANRHLAGGGSELEPASVRRRSCIRKSSDGRWDGDCRRVAASSGVVFAETAGEEVALRGGELLLHALG